MGFYQEIKLLADRSVERGVALLWFGIALAILAYSGGLLELVHRWYNQDEYGHGFFIPPLAIWLLWHRRDALKASIGAPSWLGVLFILVSVWMLVLGELSAIFLLIQLGFLLTLAGLALCYGGVSLLRICLLPIALLLFCIPLPYFVDAQLSWRLQLISSSLGVDFLRLLGVSVFLEGNVIDLGVYKLQVVEACSGLRYLYPLLSFGFLMAYMYPAALKWRALVFLSTVPLTVIMNSIRIAMVGILVGRWGGGMADGFLHYFEGWVIFLICQLFLMGEIWLIERYTLKRRLIDVQQFPLPDAIFPMKPAITGVSLPVALSTFVLFCALVSVQVLGSREEVRPAKLPLATFPLALGNWQARESSLSVGVEKALGFDDYVLAEYRNGDGSAIDFYVAYYASQRKGVSPHSPQVCIPGGGWVISELDQVTVPQVDAPAFEAVRVVIDRAGQRQVVYYWFEQRGRRISNEYLMKWYLLFDSLTRNRTDGALVRVTTQVAPNETIDVADQRLQSFIQLAAPKLGTYVPQ